MFTTVQYTLVIAHMVYMCDGLGNTAMQQLIGCVWMRRVLLYSASDETLQYILTQIVNVCSPTTLHLPMC